MRYRQLFFCLITAVAALPLAAGEMEEIVIAPGSQAPLVHGKPIQRVAVGDPKVASVAVTTASSLLITGKQSGQTTLFVWENRPDPAPAYQARLVVSQAPNISVGDGLNMEPVIGGGLKLSGDLSALDQHQAALRQLRAGAGEAGIDATASNFDSQVQIDIKVVEVSRQRLMNAGFFLGKNKPNSTKAISGPGNLSGVEMDSSGITLTSASGFLPFLKSYNLIWGGAQKGLFGALSLLEEDGFAYTLAEPSLSAISGQTASFLAGGEIPIPLRTGSGADSSVSIKYKEFGVRLMLTPTVLDRERIFLKVAPEVSELDETLGVQTGGVAVPGLRVRRTDTTIALASGESFVLSGLVSRNTTNAVDKFPFLGDIPVLGAFFRSTRFDRSDKELLMIVTAHVVRPFAKDQTLPSLPGEAYRNYDPSFSELLSQERGPLRSRTGFSD